MSLKLFPRILLLTIAIILVAVASSVFAPTAHASTFTQTISADSNGVFERVNNGDVNDIGTVIVRGNADPTIGGLRFTSVSIPQGSVITSAKIEVTPDFAATDDAALTFYGEKAADAAAFTTGAGAFDLSGRTWTNTESHWGDLGLGTGAVDSIDFSGPLQEVISQAAWVENNALVVIMEARAGEGKFLEFADTSVTITVTWEAANAAPRDFFSVRVLQGAATTTTTIQEFTIPGFGTPQACLILGNFGTVAGTIADHAGFSVGAYAENGTSTYFSWTNGGRSEHGQAVADARKRGVVGTAVQFTDTASLNTDGRASVSMIENGIRLNWFEAPSSANLLTIVLFRGFDEVAAGYEEIVGAASPGTTTDIDVGFDPDIFFSFHINGAGLNGATADVQPGFGIVTREAGSPVQATVSVRSGDGEDPTVNRGVVHNTSGILSTIGNTGTIIRDASATFITNGIRATRNDSNNANSFVGWLALKMPPRASAAMQILDTRSGTTGTQAYTGFPGKPKAVLTISSWQTAADAVADQGTDAFGFSAFNASEEYAITMSDQDNVTTTVSKSLSAATALSLLDEDGTLGVEASLDSLDRNGFTLDYSTVDVSARKFIAVAFMQPPRVLVIH